MNKSYNTAPLISVVVPVYNTLKFLHECLESIQNQTLQQLEVILVDDGSTDKSGDICDEYSQKDSRFLVIHQKNRGLSAARNVAIEKACGKYILFVDSDDHIMPNLCEITYQYAEINQADLIRFFYQEDTLFGKRFLKRQATLPNNIVESDVDKLKVAYTSGAMVWKFLILRDLLIANNLRFPENVIYEDMDFTTRLALSSQKMLVLHEILYSYRIRLGSLSWLKYENSAEQCEYCCNQGIAYAHRIGASNEAINFLIELRDKMISILSRRIENIFNDEYPKEVFYE